MKSYPSIPKFLGSSTLLHTFDKIDGSNLRFEWSKKRGWYKFGTRTRLFDESDEQFKEAIPLFNNTLSEPLGKICHDNRWDKVVVFAEFWGENSFAGCHESNDIKNLTLIDVSIHRKGILPPRDFLKIFGDYGPKYLGEYRWNKEFIDKVKHNNIPHITFEGVVGKRSDKNIIVMYKAKTQQWIDKVRERFSEIADEIINS